VGAWTACRSRGRRGRLSLANIRYGRLLCWQVADRAEGASPHRMQWLRGEAAWDADNARELGGLWHHTHSAVRGGRAGIVDNPWVIGGCSGTRVCAGQTACSRLQSAQSDACLRLDGSETVRLGESVHNQHPNDDDVGFGCSVGARAPWTGGHQMDVSARDPWTDLHQRDWRRPAGPARTEHRNLLTFGPWDW
jgi:hypothetical protein